MRITSLVGLALTVCPLAPMAACSAPAGGEKVVRQAEPIQGGTVDMGDSAVVAILINSSQGLALCSGALIGPNLVLSAHHCVADVTTTSCGNAFGSLYAASSFVVTTSYDAAAAVFNSGTPTFPTPDGMTWFGVSSVSVPGQNICGQDMSALTLSTSIAGICPIIPSVDTDVSVGETYTAIGFGITSPNGQVAGTRYDVKGMTVQCAETCNDPTMSATQEWLGGSNASQGTCEGDSGGPAIDSVGRAMGSVSRGPAGACNQTVYESYYGEATWIKQVATQAATAGGYTAAGWVTGGATSNPANGYCASGTDGGSGSSSGGSDSGASDGGPPTEAGAPDGGSVTDGAASDGAVGDSGSGVDSGGGPATDAGRGVDGSPSMDASAAQDTGGGEPDSSSSAGDAGDAGTGGSGSSSGCGCKTAGSGSGRTGIDGALALLSMAFAVAFARRRSLTSRFRRSR